MATFEWTPIDWPSPLEVSSVPRLLGRMAEQLAYLASAMDAREEEKCEEGAEEAEAKHAALDEEVKAGMAPPICRICASAPRRRHLRLRCVLSTPFPPR